MQFSLHVRNSTLLVRLTLSNKADGSLVTMYNSKVVATIPVPNHLKIQSLQRLQGPGFIFTTQDDELFYLDERDSIVREDSVPNQLPVKQISAIERCVVLLGTYSSSPPPESFKTANRKDTIQSILNGHQKDIIYTLRHSRTLSSRC